MIEEFHISLAGGPADNEDALEIKRLRDDREGFLCALADGQGGQAGGARAAQIACQAVMEGALKLPVPALLVPANWIRILQRADQAVFNDPKAGFTTLVAFCLVSDFICGGSCGDSAAILVQADGEDKILTANQSKNPPVGSGDALFACFVEKFVGSWVVLGMSDGVWKYAGMKGACKTASEKHGAEIIESLLMQVRLPGRGALQDDFTVAVFHGSSIAIGQ